MKKCDIIIPIYNAYDCLKPCIDSVIKNTNLDENRLILINDQSTDERVLPLLKEYADGKKIILLENENNLGFVGTVNKGMKYSKNDVLLLNSDTEVPSKWLDKIKRCAYSEKNVATVTPLSNNATLVSVPNLLVRNELPKNYNIEKYSKLIDTVSKHEYPELPTAHGFCMYIKREVLDKIGYFDEETFGKGYGEENDFSYRCIDYGYKNLLCDDTIVYHKESQSFNAAKEELKKINAEALKKRYPLYVSRTEIWCGSFSIKTVGKIGKKIKYSLGMEEKRKNILFVIHDFSDLENNVGGTTLHIIDLINGLRDKYNFHVLYFDNGIFKIHSYFKDNEEIINLSNINNISLYPYYNKEYKKMIENIVEGFGIDIVHIHHLMNNHTFDWIDVIKEYNLYSIVSIHDYYCLCPNINMMYNLQENCFYLKNKNCLECLNNRLGLSNDIVSSWREEWQRVLENVDLVIAPSTSVKKHILDFYPNIKKIEVIEHGINISKSDYVPNINNHPFNIAFLGVMAKHKGSDILLKLIKEKIPNVKIHLFGDSDIKSLKQNKRNYIYHGKYKRNELPELLRKNNINLVCIFSICDETYSYTLTESFASGIPVLGLNTGAVGTRIHESKCGYLLPYNASVETIKNKIIEISNGLDYEKKLENIKKYKIKTVGEMCLEYDNTYQIKTKPNKNINKLYEFIDNEDKNSDSLDSAQLKWILNSRKWKLISKIQVPNIVRKLIRK